MGRNHKNRIVSEVDPIYADKDWRQKIFRVAAYARVSTDSSDQENSLRNQKKHYDATIPENPYWEYVGLYADDGISGTSTRNRKEFNRMVADCKAGKIELIVVKEVSRFARNIIDCLNTVELLLTLDPPVGIYFEANNTNTLDAGNKIFLTLFAMFAELESELKSKSIKFGNNRCFEDGNYFCPVHLLGYEKDGKYGIRIEPEGAKTVRLMYDLFLAGYSTTEISDVMSSLSRPTAAGNLTWSPNGVYGILNNEKYCGDLIMQKTFVENFKTHKVIKNKGQRKIYYEPDHHDGIVSREEYTRSLLLLKSNQTSPYFDNRFIIRSSFITCFL
ncbi:MAG: recombinase family protein [Planctomycetaceae bacterium]|jgi:DNA invertase Pin-like site-specific DNA recombinase|nr:recombinase family protein [Planctomycetaceae bacterium]